MPPTLVRAQLPACGPERLCPHSSCAPGSSRYFTAAGTEHSFRVLAVRENKFMEGVWQSQTSATARQGVNQRQSWGLEYVFEASKRRVISIGTAWVSTFGVRHLANCSDK